MKARLDAEEEEQKAKLDPKFIKKSERKKAHDKNQDYIDEKLPTQDIRNYDFPPGFGNAFVEFESIDDCKKARKGLHLMKHSGKLIECSYWLEQQYKEKEFIFSKKLPGSKVEETA